MFAKLFGGGNSNPQPEPKPVNVNESLAKLDAETLHIDMRQKKLDNHISETK